MQATKDLSVPAARAFAVTAPVSGGVPTAPRIPEVRIEKNRSTDRYATGATTISGKVTDDIEAAPSIGPKTAARFEAIGISSVSRPF